MCELLFLVLYGKHVFLKLLTPLLPQPFFYATAKYLYFVVLFGRPALEACTSNSPITFCFRLARECSSIESNGLSAVQLQNP